MEVQGLRGLRSKALNRGGRRGFAECAWQFATTTTSAAEQSAGAAYSYGRRRELQLPVFTNPRPTSRPRIGRTCDLGRNSGVEAMSHQHFIEPTVATDDPGVHVAVWRLRINEIPGFETETVLSASERRQATRTTSTLARSRFVKSRSWMRHILSRYCDLAPSRLPIATTRRGKPYLESPFPTIRFNLSHTHDWALLAVSRHAEIGVDVEEHRPSLDTKLLVQWLHPAEKQDLEVMSPDMRRIAFIRLWCRKEALLKAKGTGLRAPLHQFRVSTSSDTPKVLAWPGEDPNWHLYDLIADEQHSAALALDRPAKSIAYKELR